jgi:hypothetical protein
MKRTKQEPKTTVGVPLEKAKLADLAANKRRRGISANAEYFRVLLTEDTQRGEVAK